MQNPRLRQVASLAVTAFAGLAFVHSASAADAPAALDKAPQTSAMRDSVVTVDSLITSENQQALARAKEQAIASGLAQPAPKAVTTSGPPPGSLTVASIYGIENDLRANIVFNGDLYERVRVGSRLGSCVIAAINGSVVLKAARKGVPAAACPTSKWTGLPPMPSNDQIAEIVRARAGALPSPAVPMPFSSVGRPISMAQPGGFRPPPPLKSNQPMVQLIPSGPMAPGQTAVPLIPRQLEPVQDERLQSPAPTN